MKRELSIEDFNKLLLDCKMSKNEFARKVGISRSHMDKIISGNTYIGDSTYEKLDLFLKKYTCQYTNVEDLLLPEPMIIGGSKVRYINVVDNEDRIVASISSKEIISISELEVECLLCD